jgi:quercetin dioxygenase-like cupin family protein
VRKLITGADSSGHSCIVEEAPLTFEPSGAAGVSSAVLAATPSVPPPSRPPGRANTNDLGVAPGRVSWVVVEYEPNLEIPVHNTDTIDFDIVLEGSVEVGLDDGTHLLEPGDLMVVNGVDHSWKAGPDGCRISVMLIGTPPPRG